MLLLLGLPKTILPRKTFDVVGVTGTTGVMGLIGVLGETIIALELTLVLPPPPQAHNRPINRSPVMASNTLVFTAAQDNRWRVNGFSQKLVSEKYFTIFIATHQHLYRTLPLLCNRHLYITKVKPMTRKRYRCMQGFLGSNVQPGNRYCMATASSRAPRPCCKYKACAACTLSMSN